MMKWRKLQLMMMSGMMLSMVACGGNSNEESSSSISTPTSMLEESVPEGQTISIVVNSNDQMKYDVNEIKVRAGQEVTLTLNHTGTISVKMMGHNWVLLKKGVIMGDFAQKASVAADNDYIPQELADQVIAHTKMLGGGESDTITFTAPEAGEYEFLCSFPGHYGIMRGKFIVI